MKLFDGVLLASDMDGTLLDSEKRVPRRNLEALKRFTEQGGRFSLATGRSPGAVVRYLEELPINAPYSLLNGAIIRDTQHQILHQAGMPQQSRQLIDDILLNFSQIGCEVFIGDEILVCQLNAVTARHMRVLELTYQESSPQALPDPTQWCKINLTGTPEQIKQVQVLLQPYSKTFSMSSSMPSFWEITAHAVDKGAALQTIAQRCGIALAHVYAVGDGYNDEPMLRTASMGFAPCTASDGIQRIADVVVCDHNEGAIADVIDILAERYADRLHA